MQNQAENLVTENNAHPLVYELFEQAAVRYPDHIAVQYGSRQWTYAELAARASAVSGSLLLEAAGEPVIGLSAIRGMEMISSVLGILKAGKAYLPLDPSYPAQRLGQLVKDSGIFTCMAEPGAQPPLQQAGLRCLSAAGNALKGNPSGKAAVQQSGVYILYTSGSTGTPKGVSMTQKAMVNLLHWQQQHSAAGPGSRTLQFAPLSFDVSFQEIFATLCTGGTLLLISDDLRLDPFNLLDFMETQQVERIFLPFVALQFLAEAAAETGRYPAGLKEVMTAGEQLKITPQVQAFFRRLPECVLYNQYGPTECHVVSQLKLSGDPDQWPALPNIGFPIDHTRLYVLNEQLELLPEGQTGELAIAGASLAEGYLNRPELTAEKFVWLNINGDTVRVYLTGDLAGITPEGIVFYGRKDDQVKIRGYRVETGEIEVQLNAIPGIQQAVVTADTAAGRPARLIAYLVGGESTDTAAVRKQLESVLPEYMIPSAFVWLKELPRTASGKTDKKALPMPERKRPDLQVLFQPAKTAREKQLAAIWAGVLDLDSVGILDNFFELGGNSLLALKTVTQLRSTAGVKLPITRLYQFPTIAGLCAYLDPETAAQTALNDPPVPVNPDEPVAIIGMEGRFPGAANLAELWTVLRNGTETISFFSPEELDQQIPAALRNDPKYVPARGIIAGAEDFDPLFFGISPKLAEAMDPQQRIFLEISHDLLEKTGYLPALYSGLTGVFAGCGNNSYYQHNVAASPELISQVGSFQVMTLNEKDYIASRTAYQLNLKGPAVSVFSACSTSLLALSQAVDSLRNQQCTIALAGAASVTSPVYSGHLYQEGAMLSQDGHCRSFDQEATGTVFSDGAGVVLLKLLSAAVKDGDTVYGVIRGTGVNNDGSGKGSFTAPSSAGQAAAIRMAIREASIEPFSLSYIETHGTATPLGDPIEIEGLKQAFGEQQERQFCAIGSIKSNMGHLTAAAGIAGLIKTTLALYHREIPPAVNFKTPNREIDFEHSPFYVNTVLKKWDTAGKRRAGVSAFGVGGTNVHVILEEYDHPPEPQHDQGQTQQLFTWSARSAGSLSGYAAALSAFACASPEVSLADIAYTLQTTRPGYPYRNFVVAGSAAALQQALEKGARQEAAPLKTAPGETVFLFPGQGAQFKGMGRELYTTEPVYRHAVDECAGILAPLLPADILEVMYGNVPDAAINDTRYAQPALFVTGYALARLWMSMGISPALLCGHSVGEYVAAHLAGVFSLQDALQLIAGRGSLVSSLPEGSMLSIRAAAGKIEALLPGSLSMAAVNSPVLCVVAGPEADIIDFARKLDQEGILHQPLQTSHAFHSAMMDPVTAAFGKLVAAVRLNRPQKGIVSAVTGKYLTDAEAQDPAYWTEHLRKTVQFSAALDTVLSLENPVLIECGPGNSCTTLARQHRSSNAFTAVAGMDKKYGTDDRAAWLNALGKVWQAGLTPDWKALYTGQQRRKVLLPAYSYTKKRYWASPEKIVETPVNNEIFTVMRRDTLIQELRELLEEASGIEMQHVPEDAGFIESGMDSLLLTQVALLLKKKFALPVTFRQLNAEYSTIGALATYLERELPDPGNAVPAVIQPAIPAAAIHTTVNAALPDTALSLIAQQLQLLSRQVELMSGNAALTSTALRGPVVTAIPAAAPVRPRALPSDLSAQEAEALKQPFGAAARIEKQAAQLLPAQKRFLDTLTSRYTQKTAGSKAYAQQYRNCMADPRVVSGFKPATKELVYSIVTNRSSGSHVWDIDGNDYVDALNGFGSNLLGYQHPVLKAAVQEQVEKGYEIGPQHELAGEVAALICEFTGADRAALCNTGSEAVLGAMRIARTVTGRSLIVAFSGSYHGINDEVIIRGSKKLRSFPAAPGILPEAVENMLILDYGTEESLRLIRERAADIAAVLVEPVQSRRPEFQPAAFLRSLRELTEQTEIVLIFDEVITGFRMHPGGAQAMFGVKADLGTYGKVIGGGMPVGAIAGKRKYMDALDGGYWNYGDDSYPETGVTYFAGTFVRHPLALAAGKATLEFLKTRGPAFQADLNENTAYLAGLLDKTVSELDLPLQVVHFGSLWKIKFTEDYPYLEQLFTLMRLKGVHIWDGFPCFLTAAHTLKEIEFIAAVFRESAEEIVAAGLVSRKEKPEPMAPAPADELNTPPAPGARLGRDQLGNPAWFISDPEREGKYLQIIR